MNQAEVNKWSFVGNGLAMFNAPSQVVKAYILLQTAGIDAKVVTPDPKLRQGSCVLGLEIDLTRRQEIEGLFARQEVDCNRIVPK